MMALAEVKTRAPGQPPPLSTARQRLGVRPVLCRFFLPSFHGYWNLTRTSLSALLLQLATPASIFAGWETLPPLPAPNGGFACGALAGKIVVLGGANWKDNTKHWLDVIWVFDPASEKWIS